MSDSKLRARCTRRTARAVLHAAVVNLVLVGLLALPAGAQVAEPNIELSPTEGPSGTEVTVRGADFTGACAVDLLLDGEERLGRAVPDVFGSFSEDVVVSADPGGHEILAVGNVYGGEFCTTPSNQEARAPFTVTGTENGLQPRFTPDKPEHTEILDGFSRERAHLKFHQGTSVRLDDGEFTSDSDNLSELHDVLDDYPDVVPSRLFDDASEEELAREKALLEKKSGREQGDKNLYYRLAFPQDTTDAEALLDDLNALAIVELAYPEPLPAPEPTSHTPDYIPQQGYRGAAPDGIDADTANTVPGGRGENVQIIDIEYDFVDTHEDLTGVTRFPNKTLVNPWAPANHGTAVFGVMIGRDNGYGVLGTANQAAAGFVNQRNSEDGYDMADAISIAAANSAPGDVIIIEAQNAGANGGCNSSSGQVGCVPVEFIQSNYDAIVAATSAGIIVVEAAGNGSEDLDGAEYDPAFRDRGDSGAIIVGAGGAPGCTAPARGRRNFSTFGARVNVQGWGECVATAGYGSLQGSSGSDDSYTGGFNGTSSASPIVASAAAILSSVAIEHGDADGLSSTEVRDALIATGTPQDTSADALPGNIGPLPNLAAALAEYVTLEADAGGPYATVEGTDVMLDGTASTSPNSDPLIYEWDLNGDGTFETTGATPMFTAVGQDDVHTVTLRVTASTGETSEDTATVTLTNVAATLAASAGAPVTEGSLTTMSGTVTDPGWLDPLDATVDWGDGNGPQPAGGALENTRPDASLLFSATHRYGDDGTFTAASCGRDDDTESCTDVAVPVLNADPTAAVLAADTMNGQPVIITSAGSPTALRGHVTDPGSDDLQLRWTWGDGSPDTVTTSLVNPPASDPPASPSNQPRDVTDVQAHTFGDACVYQLQLSASDDDGGAGVASALVLVAAGQDNAVRGAGYWYQQARSDGTRHIEATTLSCYLQISDLVSSVLSEVRDGSSFAAAAAVLDGNQGSDARRKLDRQLLAALLNFANGAVGYGELIDTDGDGLADTAFSDVITQAEAVRLDPAATVPAVLAQKDLLERFNLGR